MPIDGCSVFYADGLVPKQSREGRLILASP